MKKISTSIPAAALIVTMVLCICAFYSSSCVSEKQDPLLEYAYADKIVSPQQHDELVDHLSQDQIALLWKAMKGETSEVPPGITKKLS